jgi:hypothetical protein
MPMLFLEKLIIEKLGDGRRWTGPELRKSIEVEYNKEIAFQKGKETFLQDQAIYYNADKLVKNGLLSLDVMNGKKHYSLREGCVDGLLIFRTADGFPALFDCTISHLCKCEAEDGFRKIEPRCRYFKIYDDQKIPYTLKF